MRVAIAGAGAVGRSVAAELLENGHEVLLLDKDPSAIRADSVPDAEWLLADACELSSLEEASLQRCDIVVASTGDDKANLVISLLAKTEFAVPRTVARVNHPSNEWLFNESWGVDVSVSTPRIMSALVEEAVSIGDVVRLFTFRQSNANMVELTLPDDSPYLGARIREVPWPPDASIVALLRDGHVHHPDPDATIEARDELLFVTTPEAEDDLAELLAPHGTEIRGSSFAALGETMHNPDIDGDDDVDGGDWENPASTGRDSLS
jgi:trk system potassium uptake protein TrkA